MNLYPIKRALLSVWDKNGLLELAQALEKLGVELISTARTAKFLQEANIAYTPIEKITQNPEAFGGRMKTLSFQVESALLFKRSAPEDLKEARDLGITAIDLVVCNLYPFEKVAAEHTSLTPESLKKLVEMIDVGGPTMLRSGAKNYESVVALGTPSDYPEFIKIFTENKGQTTLDFRFKSALKVFAQTANYDAMISSTLARFAQEEIPTMDRLLPILKKNLSTPLSVLRYGENPHQKGYVAGLGAGSIESLQGKGLSYNNYLDAYAAFRVSADLAQLADQHNLKGCVVSIIKHMNPCGAAWAPDAFTALQLAWEGDPTSAFGGIICFSTEVDEKSASFLNAQFVEIIMAPSFSAGARELFQKKKNLRIIEKPMPTKNVVNWTLRSVGEDLLIQEEDQYSEPENLMCMTKKVLDPQSHSLVQFGILLTKHLGSNAIAIVGPRENGAMQLWGAGMGQPNRLDSLSRLALPRAQAMASRHSEIDLKKAILISDAFFPFSDVLEVLHSKESKITQVIQPGGSIRDNEVIEKANEFGMSMSFTGRRHFRH